ncbi:MAG: Holliday junction resolvase RuvX [Bacteriovoracaceae bacterium]|nr:Holliday junction resolvase RuvX [Bacteriovoracaceae bacterium]
MNSANTTHHQKFLNMNVLGIDFGTVITGLSYFCVGREPFPTPFGRIVYKDDPQLVSDLVKIINNEAIELIVIGLPVYMDGNESEMTLKVKAFAGLLRAEVPELSFEYQDETLTSVAAKERMESSPQYNFKYDPKKIDEVAATIILEDFFKC